MTIDGVEQKETLFKMVKSTLDKENSIIAYHDNSSSIRGYDVPTLTSSAPGAACAMKAGTTFLHPILTAETHNFPTGSPPSLARRPALAAVFGMCRQQGEGRTLSLA